MAMAWKERYKYSRRKKRTGKYFNPSHEDIEKAINAYLQKGGEIHQIQADERIPEHLFETTPGTLEDDFFLER